MTLLSRLARNLTVQVLVAVTCGVVVGVVAPDVGKALKPLGDTFINLVKMVITPIIFLTIVHGIASMADLRRLGRVGGKALLYFEIVSTAALVIGLVIVNVTRPGAGLDVSTLAAGDISRYTTAAKEQGMLEFFLHIVPSNIIAAFASGDLLPVVFFSVLFGIALTGVGDAGRDVVDLLEKLQTVFFKLVSMVMVVAPIGAFGAMAYTIGAFGLRTLLPLGRLMLERYGCDRSVVGLVIPTGYSFNLDGTSIYLSMAAIFIAQVYGVDLSIGQQLSLLGVLMLTSKGAAGVTGSGFIVLASTLAATHLVPIEGVALLLGVDRFMSEARTITNLIGNGVATLVISRSEGAFDDARRAAAEAAG